MTKAQKYLIRMIALAAAGVALLVPVTFAPGSAPEINEACADNSCCTELGSVCEKDDNVMLNYYETTECRAVK